MSYIPDARPKYEKNIFSNKAEEPKEINPYWYRLLEGDDAEFLRGFDWCVANAVQNFFDNADDLEFDEDSETIAMIKKEMLKVFREKLLTWIESERDQLNCSMIENMDESRHEKRLEEAEEWAEDDPEDWRECPLDSDEEE